MQATSYKWINNITGWLVFGAALFAYVSTAETTASLWDCGEFISGSDKLQVVHPPGAPLFLMINRLFAAMASDPTQIAYMVNIASATASAFAILFLFWIITSLAKKLLTQNGEELTIDRIIAIQGSGILGALACTFSDTMWFSAVEGEVYALSTFFISAVLWAIMRWESAADEAYGNRWLILASYLIGLSVGVHLLSLLVIPVAVVVYYFKKYTPTFIGFLLAFFIGFVLLGIVQIGVIQIVTGIAASIEMQFVNTLSLPYNSGIAFTYILVFGILIAGMVYAHKKKHSNLQLVSTSLLMIFIGFSSYLMVPIRANAKLPINMNDPSDAFNLISYLNREQYGDRPLVRGPLYTAQPYERIETGKIYYKDTATGTYGIKGAKYDYLYQSGDKVLFPRMGPTNDGENAAIMYQHWVPHYGNPTFANNLQYFFRYQLGYMYLRYFMWNFAGRQDDYQGTFENEGINGSWLSGISVVDNARLGSQEGLPKAISEQKGRNYYYLLPFIFGLLGLSFLIQKNKKQAIIYVFLFLITGIFLIVYTNSPPREPRERDYVLVGSFYTFCIWIGLAIAALYDSLKQYKVPGIVAAVGVTIISLIAVPYVMAKNGWDDHNRHGRAMARDFAINYLESCPPNAILVTAGDNDTYPLWYAQEVEGIRTDVRVMNTSLLQIDWYIDYLQRAANKSAPLPFYNKFTPDTYRGDLRTFIRYFANSSVVDPNAYVDIRNVMNFVISNDPAAMASTQQGEQVNYFPTKKFKLTVNKEAVLANKVVPAGMENLVADEIFWEMPNEMVIKDELAMLMIIAGADWGRPLCFANTVPPSKYLGLDKYLIQEGLVYRFVPIRFEENQRGYMASNDQKYYDLVMNKFKYGNLEKGEFFVDENSARMMHVLKGTHLRLAEELNRKGDKEKSLKVLGKVRSKFIDANAPYYSPYNGPFNMYNMQWVDLYYRNDRKDEAAKIYTVMLDEMADCYRFYNLQNSFAKKYQSEKETVEDYVRRMEAMSQFYKDPALLEALRKKFPTIITLKSVDDAPAAIPSIQQQMR